MPKYHDYELGLNVLQSDVNFGLVILLVVMGHCNTCKYNKMKYKIKILLLRSYKGDNEKEIKK
jgi:hypothetical protein